VLVEDVPADAALLMEFVNTLDERSFTVHGAEHTGNDEFATAAAAIRWLRVHNLLTRRETISAGELDMAITLRSALRDALAVRAGHARANTVTRVNVVLAELPVTVQFDRDGTPHLTAVSDGVAGALGEVMATVVTSNWWHRLRMCAAPDCRWVFYDTSRNAGGRWCSMAVCGNREKTRRYRERHAAG
jgi:predicted RNA-binding Zn ribbon-like protein